MDEVDRAEIQGWIEADPGHVGRMSADFFIVPGKFHALYAVEDSDGPVMYVRQEAFGKKSRMHIQFGPDLRRIRDAMSEGLPLVMADAKSRGFIGLVFDSRSPALVKWLMSRFGFKAECEAVL